MRSRDAAALCPHAHEHAAADVGELNEPLGQLRPLVGGEPHDLRHHARAEPVGADGKDPVDLTAKIGLVDPFGLVERHMHDGEHAGELAVTMVCVRHELLRLRILAWQT